MIKQNFLLSVVFFGEDTATDAIENYADLIAVARGTLIDPNFD